MSYRCNSSSPFVKVSEMCQKSVTKDFEIFPGGNGSVHLAVNPNKLHPFEITILVSTIVDKINVYATELSSSTLHCDQLCKELEKKSYSPTKFSSLPDSLTFPLISEPVDPLFLKAFTMSSISSLPPKARGEPSSCRHL